MNTNEEKNLLSQEKMMQLWNKHQGIINIALKRFIGRGVSYEDLKQEAYFPFFRAVEHYSNAPGYAFTTILANTIEWYFIRYFNTKANYTKHEMTTLNEPVGSEDDNQMEKIDLIPDTSIDSANTALQGVISDEVIAIYKKAEQKLPFDIRKSAKLYFLDGYPPKIVMLTTGDTLQVTKAKIKKALTIFKRDYRLRAKLNTIAEIYSSDRGYKHTGLHFFRESGLSSVEWYIMSKENKGII